ncbi:polymorphic toxin-type HINT domain-containing protein [Actinoplanes regularis]|uniref:Intein C-terminal splicing region/intein N-terminal splicing region n=1 Tax=Actinoplanes regularis TaxID=52697 RepID=A0A239IEQ9_9ACTN|nr:polymorphic toxin-type HINT domain-containing protein [Actinoplanes regularis]SNS92035.1 intein C-terminal splicing region/intein N-terminal splicing region [Actinoplanes regularis]
MTLDYKSFATAYGADWSSRLRLVTLPACALSRPERAECAVKPLDSDNDVAAQTVSAEVAVAGVSTLMAATAAASGPAGDYSASTLSPSSTWSAGGNSGAFTWSYPLRIPPSLGGPAPQLGLSYSSQSVDGRHAASNNQPSWVGEGFEASAGGFVERRYMSCSQDMNKDANNDKKTGDLCWETDNATLSLAGHSGELIYNATEKRWHLRGDDGTRIERKTGATNGDNDGEHWVVTSAEGIQYWFGTNRLPGWTAGKPVTNSALTAPVFGNDPSEPCHATAFKDSDCVQAWRWNLDYVVDLSGNSMSFWYQKETNKYGRNLDEDDAASYDRESWLERIDYGTRKISGVDSVLGTLAPMRVDFTVANRCLTDCDTHNATRWPDVPWDQECTGDKCKDDFSPTFWSTKRLAGVTTQVRNGSTYRNVDRWTFTHTFPDPGDGTRAGLWLSKISHTGLVGGSITLPDVEFTPVQMPNRVDRIGDHSAAMNWMRVSRIRTESGGSVSVVYSAQDCEADGPKPDPATNTRRCYPVRWVPEGYEEPVTDWLNKYVVTSIYESDNTGGAPPSGSPRVVYKYDYYDGAAWHYADDDGVDRARGEFRGLEWCDGWCEYDTINMIFNACAMEYVKCSDKYIAKVQFDRMVAMCIDIGCGNKGGKAKYKTSKKAAYKKLRDEALDDDDEETCDVGWFSFGADTEVLMADGSTRRFAELRAGDEVLASDPETGEQGAHRIDAIWVHDDDLYELGVDGEPIVTTEDHPFWNETDRDWQDVDDLDQGDLLRTPTGTARVTAFRPGTLGCAAAYNLTIDGLHTYYVLAEDVPVLVHNCKGRYKSADWQHIFNRHAASSRWPGKGKFKSDNAITIRRQVEDALRYGDRKSNGLKGGHLHEYERIITAFPIKIGGTSVP